MSRNLSTIQLIEENNYDIMALSAKPQPFAGFTALSDQIYILDRLEENISGVGTNDPRIVIIYGWGDAQPKHLTKYIDGFQKLFPQAKIIVVLSPILKALTQTLDQRVQNMRPIITAAFPSDSSKSTDQDSILIHAMSNTGGINFAATLEAYRRAFNKPLPHTLLSLDSTPGGVNYSLANIRRFSYAMALGVAAWFPWPFAVTQAMSAVLLVWIRGLEKLLGRESAPLFSVNAINNELLQSKSASRLHLYSKEDKIIWWEDLEAHAAGATRKGYVVDCVLFEGSGHVGHMRMWPDKYWGSILRAWRDTTGVKN
ncbi:hypothetical protein B7463_g9385, partial [Scytalidium lignicola]